MTEDPQSSEKTKTSDKDLQNPRVFVERKIEFCETKPDYRSRVNSLGHNLGHCRGTNNNNNNNNNIELNQINSKLSKTQEELGSLKIAHGKLQKVLSEKASELSHAVRKAEVYEREAKKLRYKLDEVRRQQRQYRQDRTSSEKECNKANREKVSSERRKNISDSITNNQAGPEKIPNLVKILKEDIYDELEDIAGSTTTNDTDVKNIYDVPQNNEHTKDPEEVVPKEKEPMPDKDNSEIIKNKSDDNKKSVVDNNQNSDDPCSNHAIYATVNLEMKKNSKRQKDCSNGNLLISEKENIVAMI